MYQTGNEYQIGSAGDSTCRNVVFCLIVNNKDCCIVKKNLIVTKIHWQLIKNESGPQNPSLNKSSFFI
jgi:hypothetical protein